MGKKKISMEHKRQPQPFTLPDSSGIYLHPKRLPLRCPIPGKFLGKIIEGIVSPDPFFPSKEEAKTYMENRITQRRNNFIEEYRRGFHGSEVLTYEPALDREVYKELNKHKHTHEDAYQETLRGLNSYTKFQVETFIGERLNVGLSKFQYDLRFSSDGVGILHGQGMDEPLLEMIARGRDTRDTVAKEIDHPRQAAEVTQFEKIQEVMGNPEAAIGTTVVSFSPPGKEGSAYAHNFYDVFILKENDKKEKYVEARRYASGLSIEESLQKAEKLQPGYTKELKPEKEQVDAFLIANPLVIHEGHKFFDQPDTLHKSLQGDPKAMTYEDFQKKVVQDETFSQMVAFYLQTLEENPDNTMLLNRTLDAIMNRADETAGLTKSAYYPRQEREGSRLPPPPIAAQINHYGTQEVRQATTGCGLSGSVGEKRSGVFSYGASRQPGNMSSFKSSAVASGEDKYGKRTFDCPDCKQTNFRPYDELLERCQHCGSEKVAC